MQFIDEVKIFVKAGDGGNGCVAWHTNKFEPRGGPAGGDGGSGGSIVILADPQLSTLLDFRFHPHFKAPSGEGGMGRDRYGKSGEDQVLKVPVGTLVRDFETGELVADLVEAGQRVIVAQGGAGGRGNIHFATATYQAPEEAEMGVLGKERTLMLELKLLADVGLLGFPNVGKSTFISVVSRARPKIANYPFTTLVPNLGVVGLSGSRSFVLADIPGIIEGAAEGHGLGHRFLRHVERTHVLIHLIELLPSDNGGERDPLGDFDTLNRELEKYDPALAHRPQVVVLGKMDVTETREAYPALKKKFAKRGVELHAISAATNEGVKELLEQVWTCLKPVSRDT